MGRHFMVKKKDKPQAIVTGAASGIGKATALYFFKKGYLVSCLDIDMKGVQQTLEEINFSGNAFKLDVANIKDVQDKCLKINQSFDRPSVLVNSAGISPDPQPVHLYEINEWHRVININLTGTFYMMKYLIPSLLKNTPSSIVNISSVMGIVANPTTSGYAASKHGVVGLTKAAALDYADQELKINCIGPGVVETNMSKDILADNETKKMLKQQTPLGRFANPEEIAELIYFLCTNKSAFITGSFIPIDGGYTAF